MSLLATIQSMLPRPERRTEAQIEDDLDDEFAFHLEMKTRELMNEGHAREAASGMARQIFGDLDRIKKKCKRIALEERIMLQRVNFIMMIIVLLMVVAVGLQVFITQRYNTLALQAITGDLARMKFEAKAAEHSSGGELGSVYIDGDVVRPGVYPIPSVGVLTVKRLVAAAGDVVDHADARVTISKIGNGGRFTTTSQIERLRGADRDDVLSADDHVHIERIAVAASTSLATSESVLVQGDVKRPGWYPVKTGEGATYLADVIASAGLLEEDSTISVVKRFGDHNQVFNAIAERLSGQDGKYVLVPGAEISVSSAKLSHERAAAAQSLRERQIQSSWGPNSGTWQQVDTSGNAMQDGGTLVIMGPDDIRNLRGSPTGKLGLTSPTAKADLVFDGGSGINLVITTGNQQAQIRGRWNIHDDQLILNIQPAFPELTEPLIFKRVEEASQSSARGAENDHAHLAALTDFVKQILTRADQDPASRQLLLDKFNSRIDSEFAGQPEAQARLREVVSEALRTMQEQETAQTAPAGEGRKPDSES